MITGYIRGCKVHLPDDWYTDYEKVKVDFLTNGKLRLSSKSGVDVVDNFFEKCHDWENDPH